MLGQLGEALCEDGVGTRVAAGQKERVPAGLGAVAERIGGDVTEPARLASEDEDREPGKEGGDSRYPGRCHECDEEEVEATARAPREPGAERGREENRR